MHIPNSFFVAASRLEPQIDRIILKKTSHAIVPLIYSILENENGGEMHGRGGGGMYVVTS